MFITLKTVGGGCFKVRLTGLFSVCADAVRKMQRDVIHPSIRFTFSSSILRIFVVLFCFVVFFFFKFFISVRCNFRLRHDEFHFPAGRRFGLSAEFASFLGRWAGRCHFPSPSHISLFSPTGYLAALPFHQCDNRVKLAPACQVLLPTENAPS